MPLETLLDVATVFDATVDELEKSDIPDTCVYQVILYGSVDGDETAIHVQSGRRHERQQAGNYILLSGDGGNHPERLPRLAAVLAQETGGVILPDETYDMVALHAKPTQATIAGWIRSWGQFTDDGQLRLERIRFYNLPASIGAASRFGERLRMDVQ